MPTAFGSAEVPSADVTVLPDGQDEDAATVVGIEIVAVGAAVAVAVGAPAADDDDAGVLEPPQAASIAPKPTAVKGIQRDWLRVISGASVNSPPIRASQWCTMRHSAAH
jgi:hypothetical protein